MNVPIGSRMRAHILHSLPYKRGDADRHPPHLSQCLITDGTDWLTVWDYPFTIMLFRKSCPRKVGAQKWEDNFSQSVSQSASQHIVARFAKLKQELDVESLTTITITKTLLKLTNFCDFVSLISNNRLS